MDFTKKIKIEAAASFNEELNKRKAQKNEKDQFWQEVTIADSLIRNRMNQLGDVFLENFSSKNTRLYLIQVILAGICMGIYL